MTVLRTLKIVKGVLAAAVVSTSLFIILLSAPKADGVQEEVPQDFTMDMAQGCEGIFGNHREECVAARCTWWGKTCSLMERHCFHPEGGFCE